MKTHTPPRHVSRGVRRHDAARMIGYLFVWLMLPSMFISSVGCSQHPTPAKKSTVPSTPPHPPTPPAGSTHAASHPAQPAIQLANVMEHNAPLPAAMPNGEPIAGYIFENIPVPAGNYYFAKRASYMFPHPWEENLTGEDRERAIWEALILHYESFRRNIMVDDETMEKRINSVLKEQKQSFTRSQDPIAYAKWVKETLNEEVPLFENQMRYLLQVDKLKDQVRESLAVTVTEEEMQQEFLNEKNHVGGEMVTFNTKDEAQLFYERFKDSAAWDQMKTSGAYTIRPVSLMTLEAYMDLWSIPKAQMYAFHAMPLGSIGPPMPFGRQWCVYRLLDKRTGDLADFPKEREEYHKQLELKKKYEALKQWMNNFVISAHLQRLPLPPPASSQPAASS